MHQQCAVLIAGISGIGKSALAMALGARKHGLIADDIRAIDISDSPMALPAFPQCKLARDVLEELALEHETLLPIRPGLSKYGVPVPTDFDLAPLPLSAIYILKEPIPGKSNEIERAASSQAMVLLDLMIYRRGVGMKIQPPPALFKAIARLVQTVPVYLLPAGKEIPLSSLNQRAQRIESHVRASALLAR